MLVLIADRAAARGQITPESDDARRQPSVEDKEQENRRNCRAPTLAEGIVVAAVAELVPAKGGSDLESS